LFVWGRTMGKSRAALKLGHLLALTAILLAAVGIHFVHPTFHQNMPACADRAGDFPQQRAQFGSTNSHPHIRLYHQCPICLFLSNFHSENSSPEPLVMAHDYAPKNFAAFKLAILQKSCGLVLGSRGPPQLSILGV